MRVMLARSILLICCISSSAIGAQFVPTTLPAGLGVNIHFTSPQPGEMEQLAAGGFKLIRMDFDWIRTEKQRGHFVTSAPPPERR